MGQRDQQFDVFLSYSTRDHVLVEQVANWLKERGLRCFMDRSYLTPGVPWPRALEEALETSKSVAVFLGAGELGRWQERELYLALDVQIAKQTPVIPVLLPGSDPALGFLSLNTWVDLRHEEARERQLGILAGAIRGRAPAELGEEAATVRDSICPYRGLLTFREEDAPFFFGRQAYTQELCEAVRNRAFVMIVGASGSGKSSVVRAGVVPRLRSGESGTVWEVATMVPTDRPLTSLIASLSSMLWPDIQDEVERRAQANKTARSLQEKTLSLRDLVEIVLSKQPGTDRLLLLVDQWEELYAPCSSAELMRVFVDELLHATENAAITVMATCRGDFYGRVAQYRPLVDRIQAGLLTLGPMDAAELTEVIEEPAARVGLKFEPGLVNRVLDDVDREPGSLPLLSFLLEQLWRKRNGETLAFEAYEAIGGVQGAIAGKAETVFAGFAKDEQDLLPKIFLQLVSVADDLEDTRRRANLKTLGYDARPVVTELADARLLVTSSTEASSDVTVEVAHEALIRTWKRSQAWVNDARGFLIWRSRLAPFVEEWQSRGKDSAAFLRGGLLAEAQRWLAERPRDLDDEECEYIDAST